MQTNEAAITSMQFRSAADSEDMDQKRQDRCYKDWDASETAMWLKNAIKLP